MRSQQTGTSCTLVTLKGVESDRLHLLCFVVVRGIQEVAIWMRVFRYDGRLRGGRLRRLICKLCFIVVVQGVRREDEATAMK